MSYLVLARKYRPRDFAGLVGQEHVVQALANALERQRLHHAYLFTGTRGVGKTTVSRILAKSLNCTGPTGEGGITARACGVCAACRDIDAGRFVDYVELDAASNRGVEEITRLLDQAVYKPVVGRFKVYMVDEVHMLSNHAFNAMLKTLEEPPEYLKFVLATTDPQKVPPTVLSRCLQFNLRPMALHTLEAHLAEVLAHEDIAAEPGALRLIARAAHGSMRDALSLADQAIAYGAGALAEDGVRQMLGAVDRGHAVRLVDALARRDGRAVVDAVEALRGLGLAAAGTLEEMAALLQQMAVLQAVPDALDRGDPDVPEAARLAALLAPDETQLLYGIVLHGRAELGLAPDEYSGLVMVLLRLLAFAPAETSAAARPPAPGGDAGAIGRPARAASPPAPGHPPAIAPEPKPEPVSAACAPVRAKALAADTARTSSVLAPATQRPAVRPRPAMAEPPPWLDAPPALDDDGSPGLSGPAPAGDSMTAGPTDVPPPSVVAPAAPAEPTASTVARTPLGDRWNDAVRTLVERGLVTALTRELALQAQCVGIDEPADAAAPCVWRLKVERDALRSAAHCERLQAALAEALGRQATIAVELGATDDTPARREIAARERRQREAERIIRDDPVVRGLLQQYATARIVPGSVKPL